MERTGQDARPYAEQGRPHPNHRSCRNLCIAAPTIHPSDSIGATNMLSITRRVYATDLMTGATIAYLLRDGRIVG
jgi:hypothetical protein